jgi:hypothetical protein
MAEKRLSMWLSENRGSRELLLPDEPPYLSAEGNMPPLPEQAARTRARAPAHAVRADLLMIKRNDTSLWRDESSNSKAGDPVIFPRSPIHLSEH